MKVSEFNYNLPEELIAQVPLEKRDIERKCDKSEINRI